jgi:uncharacterized membrane protein
MIETSPLCFWTIRAALVLLLLCWGLWAPYAIRERPMPLALKLVVLIAVAFGVFTTAVLMPWNCEGCKLW